MPSLIFVHGTGVRRAGYDSSFQLVREALKGRRDFTVHPCYWGDLGATPPGCSVPGVEAWAAPERDYNVALWGVLYEDPLYELRVLALRESKGEVGLGQLPPGRQLADRAARYERSPQVEEKLREADLAPFFDEAHREVVRDPMFERGLEPATETLAEYRAAIARAWVAEAIRRRTCQQPEAPWVPATLRDEIVKEVIVDLGGEELAFSNWAKARVLDLGTRWVQKSRGNLTGAASPIAGDILLYQSRGAPIRDRIRQAVKQAAAPVVLMGHSLGGIASVDLLVEEELPVKLLITVGSQATLFYEIGALSSLERGSPLPAHFPRWLNVFDSRDFLSYVGADVFPGKVTDVEVDNGQPFPASHSSYWGNDHLWVAIGRELP